MTDARRTIPRRALLGALALAGLVGRGALAQGPAPQAIAWPPLQLLDGRRTSAADWAGSPAVVVFWSTTCPFCKRHNAHVDKLFRAHGGRSLRVLGVALDRDADAVRRYMARNGYAFPVTVDGSRLQSLFTTRRIIPMTCVVDASGRLQRTLPGEMFEEDVMELALAASPRGG